MTTGPYPPDHGTVPSEVTVTRDGDHVVVCGVRLTEGEVLNLMHTLSKHAGEMLRDRQRRTLEAGRDKRPPRWRMWWAGKNGKMHLDGCGCRQQSSFYLTRLLLVEEVPAKVCKRTARKLAAWATQ